MTIPATITLTESDLSLINATLNDSNDILVSDSEILSSIAIDDSLITDLTLELIATLTDIPLASNSTESVLFLSEDNYSTVSKLSQIAIIEDNDINVLDLETDYSLAEVVDKSLSTSSNYNSSPFNGYFNSAAIYNGYVYLMGGYNGTDYLDTIYIGTLDSTTGIISSWTTSSVSLPVGIDNYCLIQNSNFIYIIGGATSSASANDTIYYTSINSDGSLNDWTTSSVTFPVAATDMPSVGFAYNNILYVLECYPSTDNTSFYYATLNSDGSINAWTTQTGGDTSGVSAGNLILEYNGYYYIIGGGDSSAYAFTNVYYGSINSDGSLTAAVSTTSFPIDIRSASGFIYDGIVYVYNGASATGGHNANIYFSQIQSDGSLGKWYFGGLNNTEAFGNAYVNTATGLSIPLSGISAQGSSTFITNLAVIDASVIINNLPGLFSFAGTIIVNGYCYLLGGQLDGSITNLCLYASYDASSQTFGDWSFTTSLPTTLVSFALAQNNGYLYVLGGNTVGTYFDTDSNSDYSDEVYYCSINSDGSLGSWTTSSESLPEILGGGQAIVVDSTLYLIGSYQGGTDNYSCYYSALASDGSLGSWSSQADLLSTSTQSGFISLCNYETYYYVIGGSNSANWSLDDVTLLTLDTSTNTFTATTQTSLPVALRRPNSFVYDGVLYVQDGGDPDTSTLNNDIYYSTIGSDGTLGSWSTESNVVAGFYGNAFTYDGTNNNIISLGGFYDFNSAAINTNYSVALNLGNMYIYNLSSPPTGNTVSSVPNGNSFTEYTSYYNNDYLYIIGVYENGSDGAGISDFYVIDTSTNIWSIYSLPTALRSPSTFIYDGLMYLIGGFIAGTGDTTTIYYATVNSDGSVGTWTTSSTDFPIGTGVCNANNVIITSTMAYIIGLGISSGGAYEWSSAIYEATLSDTPLVNWSLSSITVPATNDSADSVACMSINNSDYVDTIFSSSTGVITLYQAPISSNGILGSFSTITPNITMSGNLLSITNLGNGSFIICVNNGGVLEIYESTINDMSTWSLIQTNNSVYGINAILIDQNLYYAQTANAFKLLGTTSSTTEYEISLNNALSSIPTNIYIPLSLKASLQWNSSSDIKNLELATTSISGGTVTYTYSPVNNPYLYYEDNYPILQIKTNSYSSIINSFSLSINGYSI